MITRAITLTIAALVASSAFLPVVHAESKRNPAAVAHPAPMEDRIRTYTYSADVVFDILATTRNHVHLQLEQGEGLIEEPVWGDTIQWMVTGGTVRDIFIKPTNLSTSTTLTVLTNRRTYSFKLRAVKESEAFQKVTFNYPDSANKFKLLQEQASMAASAEAARLSNQVIAPAVDVTALNYDYDIIGEAPFKPLDVANDGRFMFLRMPQTQAAPAVFLLDSDNKPSLVTFRQKGGFIVVERLADALLLKIGNQEVRVHKRSATKPVWTSSRTQDAY